LFFHHRNRWNRTNLKSRRELLLDISIYFYKFNITVLGGNAFKDGTKSFAGGTPLSPEIENNDLVVLDDLFDVFTSYFAHGHKAPPLGYFSNSPGTNK
jgi:hypothetical protein